MEPTNEEVAELDQGGDEDEAFAADAEGNICIDGDIVDDLDEDDLPPPDSDEDDEALEGDDGSGSGPLVPGDDDSLHSFEAHTGLIAL
jgi:hypothetical protein